MILAGGYNKFEEDVFNRYNNDYPVTLGILIADYRQSLAKEYILNYINVFHQKSNKYIDFFIPGYTASLGGIPTSMKDKNGNRYYFNDEIFDQFIKKLEIKFAQRFKYEFSPVLILVELTGNNFVDAKIIIIDLEETRGGIKRTGVLFLEIFEIAKRCVKIEDFSTQLEKTYIKGTYADILVDAIDSSILSECYSQYKNIRRFQIK
ncbi:MAG: hypothetical protein NC089_13370 [Bacteroides sp.]|nr:hypothetical protein [Bacteroides sp.]MCM1550958.1 hypothetical protein [Clostridium sp.]